MRDCCRTSQHLSCVYTFNCLGRWFHPFYPAWHMSKCPWVTPKAQNISWRLVLLCTNTLCEWEWVKAHKWKSLWASYKYRRFTCICTQKSECVSICVCGCLYASISTYMPSRNFQITLCHHAATQTYMNIHSFQNYLFNNMYLHYLSILNHPTLNLDVFFWSMLVVVSLSYFMILSAYLLLALETFLILSLMGGVRRHKPLLHVRMDVWMYVYMLAPSASAQMSTAHPLPIALSSIHSPCIIYTYKSSVSSMIHCTILIITQARWFSEACWCSDPLAWASNKRNYIWQGQSSWRRGDSRLPRLVFHSSVPLAPGPNMCLMA